MHRKTQLSVPLLASSVILDATRSWRAARDQKRPVQPAMCRALRPHDCMMLAPQIDSLLRLYELCTQRRFRVGLAGHIRISRDEYLLLADLCAASPMAIMRAVPDGSRLARALRAAIESVRVLLTLALNEKSLRGAASGRQPSPPP